MRNTWIICLEVRNNPEKSGLMPDVVERLKLGTRKGLALPDESAAYQLVGGVTATKAKTGSWSERTTSHTGTETRSRHLRVAAVENFSQWAKA